jgi:hypothetical protein
MKSPCSAGMTPAGSLFSPVAGHFPNDALGPEFTVEPRTVTFTALFNIQTLATLSAKTGFVLLADGKGFAIGMVSALHLFFALNRRRRNTLAAAHIS